nr:retrovirus-related Pol polyprotein from transposon TNT 1-94 [Tanacetum cinerariifolium]
MEDSTCKFEYIAACEASKEAIWMKNFIIDLRVVPIVQDPIEIFCNNESAVALTKEPKDHRKSKHIERKYHFVLSKVEEGHVIVKHIRSEDNPADLFIKNPLPGYLVYSNLLSRSYYRKPPMLEKGHYIPWESRFKRFLDTNLEEGDRMRHSIEKGPYVRPMIPNSDKPTEQILEPFSKMTQRKTKLKQSQGRENDFMLDNSYGDKTLQELTVAVIMMALIQSTDDNAVSEISYVAKAISEVNASTKVHEQVNRVQCKTFIHTSDDD